MKTTQQLHDLGQSLWLDNTTRALLTSDTHSSYISALAAGDAAKLSCIESLHIKHD